MSNMKLSWRMMGISAASMIGFLVLCATFLNSINTTLLEDRRDKTKNLVEAAYGVVAYYAELEASGSLSRKDAQEAAKLTLRSMRYDNSEYLWINDFSPRMVMHPYKPALDGKDLSDYEDENGKRLFVEMVKIAEAQGGGFVNYYWNKRVNTAVEKIAM